MCSLWEHFLLLACFDLSICSLQAEKSVKLPWILIYRSRCCLCFPPLPLLDISWYITRYIKAYCPQSVIAFIWCIHASWQFASFCFGHKPAAVKHQPEDRCPPHAHTRSCIFVKDPVSCMYNLWRRCKMKGYSWEYYVSSYCQQIQ